MTAEPSPVPVARRSLLADAAEIGTDLWDYRDLLYQLTLRDIRIRYKQAVMGFGWAILMPVLIIGAGALVRYAMAYLGGGTFDRTDVAGITVKALPWAFFIGAINFGTTSLVSNANLVTKIYFPREVLPLSATIAQAFDTMVGALAVAIMLPLLGVRLTAELLWVPLLAVQLLLFTGAVALFLSVANLFFRDVKYLVQVVLTFGIFFTPVFFEPAMFGPAGAQLMMLNPLAPVLEGLRLAVVEGHNLLLPLTTTGGSGDTVVVWSPWYLAYTGLWSLGGLLGSALVFHRLEFVFAEYV